MDNELKFNREVFVIPAIIVFSIWFIYWVEIQFGFNFNKFGIYPRTFKGFKGGFFNTFYTQQYKSSFY